MTYQGQGPCFVASTNEYKTSTQLQPLFHAGGATIARPEPSESSTYMYKLLSNPFSLLTSPAGPAEERFIKPFIHGILMVGEACEALEGRLVSNDGGVVNARSD